MNFSTTIICSTGGTDEQGRLWLGGESITFHSDGTVERREWINSYIVWLDPKPSFLARLWRRLRALGANAAS